MPTEQEWEDMRLYPGIWSIYPWMQKIGHNDRLWLVKEKGEAFAASHWELPYIGGRTGKIWIGRYNDNRLQGYDQWYVDPQGRGFDGIPLLRPQCTWEELQIRPDAPREGLFDVVRRFDALTNRVVTLERRLFDMQQHLGMNNLVTTQPPIVGGSMTRALRDIQERNRPQRTLQDDLEDFLNGDFGETLEAETLPGPPPGIPTEVPERNIDRRRE